MARLEQPTKPSSTPTEISNWDWQFRRTSVDLPEEIESLENALVEVQRWLTEIWENQEPRWLLLCGATGNGKTHLAQRAAAWLRKYGERCYNRHRQTIDPMMGNTELIYSYRQERGVFARWNHDLLLPAKNGDFYPLRRSEEDWYKIVDELGAEQRERGPDGDRPTAFAQGQLTALIEGRMRRWSLFTSNLLRRDFAKTYDPRVADRFSRWPNRIVEIEARSFALRMEEAEGKKKK